MTFTNPFVKIEAYYFFGRHPFTAKPHSRLGS